jgi:hypothetical protein
MSLRKLYFVPGKVSVPPMLKAYPERPPSQITPPHPPQMKRKRPVVKPKRVAETKSGKLRGVKPKRIAKRKNCKYIHPKDKWIALRAKMRVANLREKELIRKTADFYVKYYQAKLRNFSLKTLYKNQIHIWRFMSL